MHRSIASSSIKLQHFYYVMCSYFSHLKAFFFFRKFQPIAFALDNGSLSLNQDASQFLV